MLGENCLVWNVRGLNSRARRNVVREMVDQENISLLTLQETKLDDCSASVFRETCGAAFDYVAKPASNTCGGILLAWKRDTWSVTNQSFRSYCLTAMVTLLQNNTSWWLTCVYGPQADCDKIAFLDELRDVRTSCDGMWVVCGDFNLIYQAADKNNQHLNRSMMNRFRRFIDDTELQELNLKGRLYTWTNDRERPTLERLDRVFASEDWVHDFPDHELSALGTECSDHAPLLLKTDCSLPHFKRFHFENFWPKCEGYLQVVEEAWRAPLPWATTEIDAFRCLDHKLRNTAKALKSWSAKHIGSVRLQLAIAKEIVLRLDCAQDFRSLSPLELALRRKAKLCSLGLASLQRTLIRQRARISYLAEGDANTRFFHLQACHRSRKNHISKLHADDVVLFRDEEMTDAAFNHFDAILGSGEQQLNNINLDELNLPSILGELLDQCFSAEEVWQAIVDMPTDKAPGPDGYTGLFYRTAWPIIKDDVMRAFNAIWSLDGRSFYLVNQAYMVLLRKRPDASSLCDFRPISLIHSFAKLFTKVLSRRLAPFMHTLVRHNQSAFIRSRLIHENFRAVQLTAKLLHRSKRPSVLLKLDIAKAFDTVNWRFLLSVLQHCGFTRRWRDWISLLLSSASTKIILNGSPGRRICHARGLRQGDPLSPLLFVIVMEVLNALLRLADERGLLCALHPKIKERTFLYADDVVVFLSPVEQDLVLTRVILEIFAGASGLKTNLSKCKVSPIQCDLEASVSLLTHFPGKFDPFPICYLGIPLGLSKLCKNALQPLVDKVASRLPTWKAGLINRAGRTVLIKSTLSAIPIHTAMAVKISPWVIKCIDGYRRGFLWSGAESAKAGHCRLAWLRVCRPTELGGLGIVDLHRFGYALRLRWLWLKRTDDSRSWSDLPAETETVVEAMFQASIYVEVGNGQKALFWTDRWLQGHSVSDLAPCLSNAVGPRIKKQRTVAQALNGDAWVRDITGALTVQVILDFFLIWDRTRDLQLDQNLMDKICWKWTSDRVFSTASAYRSFFFGQHPVEGAKLLRKSRAPGKCKFFIWLVIHDRCWTAARRKKHGLQDDDSCALCAQMSETVDHLLIACPFTREVWFRLLRRSDWLSLAPNAQSTFFVSWWSTARKQLSKANRRCFDSLVILTSWMLGKRGMTGPSIDECVQSMMYLRGCTMRLLIGFKQGSGASSRCFVN